MATLSQQILSLHHALTRANLSHAFGGALALAWCTERARGTIDIDINVFVGIDQIDTVIDTLPNGVAVPKRALAELKREGQVRLWWDKTPVDLFLNTTDFHAGLETRVRWEQFAGDSVPFLSCLDLAVFKAFFNRTKDWADLEEMVSAGTLDVSRVKETLARYLEEDDPRFAHLAALQR
ncbi:MAG TPA: hypothetical protein VJ998_09015 [Pseudomonadales bacterium]|nr:hypothetical protein [Pseudomonadales bacterium]